MMDKNRLRNLIETLDKFVDELQYYQNIENQLLEMKSLPPQGAGYHDSKKTQLIILM